MANSSELPWANDLPYYVDQMYPHCSDDTGLQEPNVVAADSLVNPPVGTLNPQLRDRDPAAYVAWLLGESLDGGGWSTT